jgi:large subunit ribosomal protein L7/L12
VFRLLHLFMIGGFMPGAAAAAPAEEVEEKTHFNVLLADIGPEKIKVIKEVRAFSTMGLKEAKDFVEGTLPAVFKEDVPKAEAEDIKKKFEEAGAKVEIR